jgi:uncharacterized membrane protein
MIVLIGILIVIVGFCLRFNPLLVVTCAGVVTGIAGGMHATEIVSAIGKAFSSSRYMGLVWLTIPVIVMLEHSGLHERARTLISSFKGATTGRVLMMYFVVRQATAALGLHSLGGHAQTVRPLIAPMAEAATEARYGQLSKGSRELIRAHAAGVDNVASFFGEDIFIAMSSILLVKAFLDQNGIVVTALQLSLWAVPTGLLALLIHGVRLWMLDRRLRSLNKNSVPASAEASHDQA